MKHAPRRYDRYPQLKYLASASLTSEGRVAALGFGLIFIGLMLLVASMFNAL